MSSSRLKKVAKAIEEIVSKNDIFLVQEGVWIISGNEANSHLDEGTPAYPADSLHLSTDSEHAEKELSTERIAEILREIEAEDYKFWMIHPKDGTVLTVENKIGDLYYETVDSYFVNPSAEQDMEEELQRFLDFLDNTETEVFGAFPIWAVDGQEVDCIETILIHSHDVTPAEGIYYEQSWLTFENSDPYNSGERRVQDELLKFARVLSDDLDAATVQRINKHYGADIRNEFELRSIGMGM